MNVLMFGWEFPPLISGGLGTACFGLTRSLSKDIDVTFVLPYAPEGSKSHVRFVSAKKSSSISKVIEVSSTLRAYDDSESYRATFQSLDEVHDNPGKIYGKDLIAEVERYAREAGSIARNEPHDVIHAHDWLTFKAGVEAKHASGKPLVVHVHATEYDRTGGNPDPYVREIECYGMEQADRVIAVSDYTKRIIVSQYHIPEEKVSVVHNGFDADMLPAGQLAPRDEKMVLFLGRLTMQKGPEYFMSAAKRVLDVVPDASFVVAGDGDMFTRTVHQAIDLGIADKVSFTGFLSGPDITRAYHTASAYVMPSISEPFGITALEAIGSGVPAILTHQSGVSEVVRHALKADFWDVEKLANHIAGVLEHEPLRRELTENSAAEIRAVTWDESAKKVRDIYATLTSQVA